jgi:hypothetical protein
MWEQNSGIRLMKFPWAHIYLMQCGQLFSVSGQMYGLVMWTYMLFHMKYEG